MVGMVDFGLYPFVLALYWFFDALPHCHFQSDYWDLLSHIACLLITPFFLVLALLCIAAVMPIAVACVIDGMVCICVGLFVHGV
jgi:hypothetical protein